MRDIEYDSFGPWIYEIDETHTMPPVFRDHYNIAECPKMLFKIPVNEERRNLRPGMNMYRLVVGLYKSYIYILALSNGQVSETKIAYDDIEAVANSIDLLEGIFTLYIGTGMYEIDYNASSAEIMNRVVAIVREELKGTGRPANTPIVRSDIVEFADNLSTLYKNMFMDMKKREKVITPVLFQKRVDVQYLSNIILYKVVNFFLQSELLSSMYISLEKELVLISRGNCFNYRRFPVHKKAVYYIPFQTIRTITITDSKKYRNISRVSIDIGNNVIESFVEKNNRDLNNLMSFGIV